MKALKSLALTTVISLFLTASLTAFAEESISQVGKNAQQKQALVTFLKDRLARHKKMTAAQIVADLDGAARKNIESWKNQGQDVTNVTKAVNVKVDEIKAIGDKRAMIVIESGQLQQAMSSDNYIFGMTIENWSCVRSRHHTPTRGCNESWDAMSATFTSLFTIPIDLIILPFEIIATLATGF